MTHFTEPTPLIFGCEGLSLTSAECAFFKKINPWGLILFRWNIETPEQTRRLITQFKECVGRESVPILVDAEGGRVFRLPPSFGLKPPPFQIFGDMWKQNPEIAYQACLENARQIGIFLRDLGFTVNCSPLLDLRVSGAHDIIGDRAFSEDPIIVGELGKAAITGFLKSGITPVIKHLPGHGASHADSHDELPVIDLSKEELAPHLVPFQMNCAAPWAMTAHIVYSALDPTQPATFSSKIIQEIIREKIGFNGILMSDDLYMNAITGHPSERVKRTLAAGCDVALYCRGGLSEFEAAVQGLSETLAAYPARHTLNFKKLIAPR